MDLTLSRGVLLAALAGLLAPASPAQTADDLLDGGRLQDIRLTIHPDDWRKLRANVQDNTEYPCEFGWRGLLTDCQVRQRGRGSRSVIKPGLRLDFSFGDQEEFLGLKSLVLKNVTQDASMMRERLTMRLAERMGLPAPREAHARLYVNDAYFGLYLLVEPVDKRFLKIRFGENAGYLYQYVQPAELYNFEYLGPDFGLYPFEAETHEKNPQPGPLVEMIRRVNQSADADFLAAAGEYLDINMVLSHVALEAFLAQYDGFLAMNNFYFYRPPGTNLHRVLIWDQDGAFAWKERSLWEGTVPNVLFRRALGFGGPRQAYLEAAYKAGTLAGGPGGWLATEIERVYAQVRQAALADPNKQCGDPRRACTNEEFEAAVESLREFARERLPFVDYELDVAGFRTHPDAPRLYDAAGVFFTDAMIVLHGENLAAENASAEVLLNGFAAQVESASAGEIAIQPPPGVSGRVPVVVLVNGVPGNRIWIDIAAPQ